MLNAFHGRVPGRPALTRNLFRRYKIQMKALPICALISCALVASAFAKTYQLPEEESIMSITVPDSWDTDEIEDGIESTSPDGEVYFYAEMTDADNVKEAMTEAVKYLQGKGVTVDADSAKQQEGKVNDMDVVSVSWDGKDKDGAAKISLTVVAVTKGQGVLLVYWGSAEGEKKNEADLAKISDSIKKL